MLAPAAEWHARVAVQHAERVMGTPQHRPAHQILRHYLTRALLLLVLDCLLVWEVVGFADAYYGDGPLVDVG